MPRYTQDAQITTKAARERLAVRPQPYWRSLGAGTGVGYRKGKTGGVWLVRALDARNVNGYAQAALGAADDALKADGVKVFEYRQAENKAREWIAAHNRAVAAGEDAPPAPKSERAYTVADAIADYLQDYAARGGKALVTTRTAAAAHILPTLGSLPVQVLTKDRLKAWHRDLAAAPARLRAKAGTVRHRGTSGDDPDAQRRRRSTANRVLTVLKAALNHARAEGKATCPADAWAGVKPFREADQAKVRYLLDDEMTRLMNACPPDFRALVTAALLTGCRYGELAALRSGDFDPQAGTVTIARSKSGKPRHVALTDEGREFFQRIATGKVGAAVLFERDATIRQATRDAPAETERRPWAKSDQFRCMHDACTAARIAPAIGFHILRHTYGARLAMRGVPMAVIAAQLGHKDTRMTEKHYAHLGPSYVAETVRASFGALGIVAPSNVAVLRSRGSAAG